MVFAFVALVAFDLTCLWLALSAQRRLRKDCESDVTMLDADYNVMLSVCSSMNERIDALEANSHPPHDAYSVPIRKEGSGGGRKDGGKPVLRGSAGKPGSDLGSKRAEKKATGRKPVTGKGEEIVDINWNPPVIAANPKPVGKNGRVRKRK